MADMLLEISKYLFLILMAIYVAMTFFAMARKESDFRKGIYFFLECLSVLFYLLGMANLVLPMLESGDSEHLMSLAVLAGMELLVLILLPILMQIFYRDTFRLLLCQMQMLLAIGFVMLARLNLSHARRQFIIIAVSLVIFLIVPVLIKKWDFLKKLTWVYGGVGLAALLLVLFRGRLVNGSKLNFNLFGLIFQPSEAVKLLFAFFIAGLLSKSTALKNVILSAGLAAVHVLVLVASKDLGSALIYFIMYVAMLYVASGKHRYLLAGWVCGMVAAVAAYLLFSHVHLRVQIWLDPFSDPDNKGYQLTQSLFGLATGGWFGMGLGHGAPSVIPFVEADFIFSAIAEEFGVLFGILLILLCLSVLLEILILAGRIRDPFYRLVAVGLGICYGVQVILTIGGGTGFIPLTGVTLPLISNGGTSAMVTLVLFGVLQGIYMIRMEEFDEEDIEREDYDNKLQEWEEQRQSLEADGWSEEELADEEAEFFAEEDARDAEREEERQVRKGQERCIFVNGLLYSLAYLLMFANIVRFVFLDGDSAMVNSYNTKRMAILQQDNTRGTIFGKDEVILAESVTDENGTENRVYPYGEIFSHTVGFAVNGGMGVERVMQKYLITSDVSLAEKMENGLNGVKNPGNNVYTSLDPALQQLAYDCLGSNRGAVVVTEVSTGRVLAMVSKPGFDPAEVEVIWDELLEDEDSGRLVNRASQGQYPPGSTFKIVTALEYIRENPTGYTDYNFECSGRITEGDISIQCFHGTVHGTLDLLESFAKSCNSSFANIGLKLDTDDFADTLLKLHFNEDLPFDLESNSSKISMRSDLTTEKRMQTAIGQAETMMSPLHLNMITQSIANGGEMMQPYVVEQVVSADGTVLKKYTPQSLGAVLSSEEAATMKEMMEAVVDHGTATRIRDLPFTVAGKTGSAEYSADKQQSHAWFTGFAPADDPQIAVTVILEGAGSGGEVAAPIAGKIFARYMTEQTGE